MSPDLDQPSANGGEEKVEQVQPRVQQRLKDTLRQVPGLRRFVSLCRQLAFPFRVFSTIAVLSKQVHFVRRIIEKHQINALLIAESSPDYGAPTYIHAAHHEGIPVVTATIEQARAHHYADTYLTANFLDISRPLKSSCGSPISAMGNSTQRTSINSYRSDAIIGFGIVAYGANTPMAIGRQSSTGESKVCPMTVRAGAVTDPDGA